MDYEKLGVFYLGREHDPETGKTGTAPVLYDARDLTTHAVCVGMTGSGKTGLCISLLEEAAIDAVPALIIDPKGDISNRLLTFPDLAPGDFLPWVNPDDARRKGLTVEQHAARQAELWRKGLSDWGQDSSRIELLNRSADVVVYTPGSDAGVPVSILSSFVPPSMEWETEGELVRERIQATVSALLALIGVEADPVRSREHILLSTIFEHYWREGKEFGLPALIMAIQNPPVRKLGVFDVDTFFPRRERFDLAMTLNGLVASPSFRTWLQGQPLDIAGFLATPEGRCRHSIFSLAHLGEGERMFFVTLLLNQLISWMRTQEGTASLRALLYMDEVFGYLPPVANPPSKLPLLTLLRQARAFGVGVVLTTQNPVDLDYKGLSNTGTWFIGRLQTERDRDRLLDGLLGVSGGGGRPPERADLERTISGLSSRVFLLHNVHDDGPVVFHTRWAMSYLRGPLSRGQIRTLMEGRGPDPSVPPVPAREMPPAPLRETGIPAPSGLPAGAAPGAEAAGAMAPPQLPPEMRQGFLPLKVSAATAGLRALEEAGASWEVVDTRLAYRPALLATGTVHFVDRRRRVKEEERFGILAPPPSPSGGPDWDRGAPVDPGASGLSDRPELEASFEPVPESMNELREMKALEKDLQEHLYRSRSVELLHSDAAGLTSRPGEGERDFTLRVNQALREKRDGEVDKLRRRYAGRLRTQQNRLRRAEETLEKRKAVATSRKGEILVSVGESLLSVLMGRRPTRAASTTMGKYRQSRTASMSISEALEAVDAARREISAMEEELQQKIDDISRRLEEDAHQIGRIPVSPRRNDVDVDFFGLAWTPRWLVQCRNRDGRTGRWDLPAF